jgi:deoxyribodipyrimidine photo-lyase
VGAHQAIAAVWEAEAWHPGRLAPKPTGSKAGWWGASEAAEAFLDELVTWREVGFNVARTLPHHDRYESLPAWAKATLAKHASDPRPHCYDRATLEAAETHDPIWNAAQRQLLREGKIHNYMRMLWGKKVLEWSASPEEALETLLELNDRWALDGRDPNSVSGVTWCLGRFDRAWGPERSIFGTIRYMSSDNTARKLDIKPYLARYGR